MKDIIVETKDLTYVYADGTKALDGINLNIERGERIAIMGANGSGKSTFFLTLNGISRPTSGKVYIDGKEIDYSRKGLIEVRRKVGIVFQDPDNQLFSSSVRQEISFGLFNIGYGPQEVREKVEAVIRDLNIESFSEKPTHFLSGGQKKRVAVADILVMEPEIMILDEPASGLDPKHIKLLDDIIDQLTDRGITVIIATHDAQRSLSWADRLILFHEGKIIGEGKPVDVLRDAELLQTTNLEKPAVLKLFDHLTAAGILENSLTPPVNEDELEHYIKKTMGREDK
ncbi:MAG: energy-coupling factor ABC transporter ATP-binding protein [Emergencia sp.]|nr:ATP-binding cassette domain-containing protein [Emergencia sp.]